MNNKISYLKVNGFRSFKDLTLNNLGNINLIVGQNNSGKTTLLEVLDLACNPLNLNHLISTSLGRDRNYFRSRYTRLELVSWLFPKSSGNNTLPINILMKVDNMFSRYIATIEETTVIENIEDTIPIFDNSGEIVDVYEDNRIVEVEGLEITLSHQESEMNKFEDIPITSSKFSLTRNSRVSLKVDSLKKILPTRTVLPSDHRSIPLSAKLLSEVILEGDKPKILMLLKLFDNEIDGIELLNLDEHETIPYIKHQSLGFVPISVFGDGLRRALTLASALVRVENGVLFVDEIETAFHSKLLGNLFSWLVSACTHLNVQLFATTHSLEAIDAILSLDEKHLLELTTFRLEINNGKHKVKRFSGNDLYDLRHELGQDVR